ncbi:MAG: hypothetical protein DKM50_05755 [Candidatus Margulisiibacteriota bacterium]|nr:MAG: hypothetical protein A2X43_07895 [Candidatus Margulisbacteria bacterium GWD2_39_127]OGI04877.1 MAG: hypothetical protein A2X42_05935 [Candidatus Margulisbacteria bacterium GWF2_38_17]OGI07741.1 MAG: hypothetical protein A2X41_01250 [Candidatus Margulisbacteria bacterium GWE2_39_32]PZM80145.1 MAG: hypothetical protein DKM50_05755 [Candidatus Margulisiibacteriota bacterium]HAR63123.1 hypothetical protein [Candidatus Margulisiibacteriota bacterium]
MAIGMMTTITFIGLTVTFGKNTALATLSFNKPVYAVAQKSLSIVGASLIIVISILFLLSTIR